jgi:hypothetical protein
MIRSQNVLPTFLTVLLFLFSAAALQAQIAGVLPSQNALHVASDVGIVVTFSQNMIAATINDATFLVWGSQSGRHKGEITYDAELRRATLTPAKPFSPGEVVTVILTNGVLTSNEQALSKFIWHFTIGVNPSTGKFTAPLEYAVGANPYDLVAAYLDGYQDLDLAVASNAGSAIYIMQNTGDGAFTVKQVFKLGNKPNAVFAFDADGDGDLDLAVPNASNIASTFVSILRNDGEGNFTAKQDYGIEGDSQFVFAADYDGDGDMDLAVRNFVNVLLLKNNGAGVFQSRQAFDMDHGTGRIFASDFDSDGDLDMAVTNSTTASFAIFKNKNGDGTFEMTNNPNGTAPYAVFAAELDGDGDTDLAMIDNAELVI